MPKDDQNELFVVVDKNDNILGYKTRYECHHNKNLIHRAVGVVIFNKKGEILLQKRSKNKDKWPGSFTISASGHVAKGETYKKAAEREMEEEIGCKINLKFKKKFLSENHDETEMDVAFSGEYDGPFKIEKSEVDEIKFFSIDALKDMKDKLTPFAKRTFKKLNIL